LFDAGRTILGLVLVEQLFREHNRRGVGTSARFAWACRTILYDLVLFADALLYRGMDPNIWAARGIVNGLIIPLLALAATRNRDWNLAVSVSRSLISGSTALFASGGYLVAIAGVGYYVATSEVRGVERWRSFSYSRGFLLLVLVLVSGTFRSRFVS